MLAHLDDTRWIMENLSKETLVHYSEHQLGHLSYFTSKNMEYFSGEVMNLLEEYHRKRRNYKLIGVVQVGYSLYEMSEIVSYLDTKQFLSALICEYRRLGYTYVALGGLLKADKSSNTTGLKFGLSNSELDQLLSWTRPNFVLGGLALTRLPILKKYQVWADSSGWIWWNERYDGSRFAERDVMAEVFAPIEDIYSAII